MDGSARGDSGLMPTLVCLGMGYCARYHVSAFGARFDRCVGTTRRAEPVPPPGQQRLGDRAVEILPFDATSHELAVAISQADALLISAAPDEGRDPVLAAFADAIARAPRRRFVVYLSTIGVYGDSGGSWISETAPAAAAATGRARVRIDAEFAWQALGAQRNLPVAIFRLGGIYGPERNALVRLLRGTVHRIAKAGHVSNRIHVHDIAQAIDAAFARRADGVFNIVDDEPAPPSDPIAFAAGLLGIDPPPEIPYAEARQLLSPLALSFYDGCIRARNEKLKTVLGVKLRYPTYREGLRALYQAGNHLARPQSSVST